MDLTDRGDGTRLATERLPGRAPTVVFLPGFRSTMDGEKAAALAAWCARAGQAMLRLDYSGHGRSEGRFADGTIGRWTGDAACLLDRTEGPVVLVGSSMGGWIALLLALRRPERVAALVGVAAAPDFTERLMWDAMLPHEQAALRRLGTIEVPTPYGAPFPLTWRLIEEARAHLLLDGPVALACPVRLLHGQADAEVPWETAPRLAARLASADVRTILVKDATHRFSRPQDLALLCRVVAETIECFT